MAMILRPTRGGEASFPNQDRAIAVAQERGADLLLLYVADVRFLDRFASAKLVDVESELEEMGEFLLAMAQERAEKAGVRAETLVCRGAFHQALQEVSQEYPVTAVMLGAAVGDTGVTTPDFLEDLTRWILTEIGVEVLVVHEGEIVEHHKPS